MHVFVCTLLLSIDVYDPDIVYQHTLQSQDCDAASVLDWPDPSPPIPATLKDFLYEVIAPCFAGV